MKKRPYLQAVRWTRGLSQDECARLIGISQPYLSQLENGYVPCPDELMKKIANQLGIDFLELRRNISANRG